MIQSPLSTIALAATLAESYQCQLDWYTQLRDTMQQELSRVILSRGDLSGLMGSLERKQQLLNTIITERDRVRPHEEQWQKHKGSISVEQAGHVNGILDKIEVVIRDFLASEEQLKRYVENKMPHREINDPDSKS